MHKWLLSLLIILSACTQKNTLFKKISPNYSGIHFNNQITESDTVNPIDLEFLYNGGGIASGDFNNDGLTDLYFTGSQVSNKLYLNKGKLQFEDITNVSKTNGDGRWCNGVASVDINNDGLLDIYVCASIKSRGTDRANLLYINKGLNADGIPVFNEEAKEYGLADTSFSVQAAFFDYDNDGDLDMYLVTTKLAKRESVSFSNNLNADDSTDVDKLFRNEWDSVKKHPYYKDVSKESGITEKGFGLGISITDINNDGWKDIYVTNDFYGNDFLLINNKNGTFSNKIRDYFKHTSQNAMGVDINDINNDGNQDVISVDMNPEDNFRKKKNMNGHNYYIYQNMLYSNTMLQYVRNTVQLNSGPINSADTNKNHPVFSDISFFTGMAETDWSWNVLMADMDNDGLRDVLITNGYPRDVTDHDFAFYRKNAYNNVKKQDLIKMIPQIKVPNYGFKNLGNLTFENKGENWGLSDLSFSNGAIVADLDNDGDLDYVINNINQEAFLYQNLSRISNDSNNNFINIHFNGDSKNKRGIGAWIEIYYNNTKQVYENNPYRGYLSCVDANAFFGLGNFQKIDSLIVIWPNNRFEKILNPNINCRLDLKCENAKNIYNWDSKFYQKPFLEDVTELVDINYLHNEIDYIDFDSERLIPHKLSENGPPLAVGDVDNNGLEDLFVGGSGNNPGVFFLQQVNQKFKKSVLPFPDIKNARRPESMGVLLFDADGDGDLDLYCSSGSNEFLKDTKNYQDVFYTNNGKGVFSFDTSNTSFPRNYASKSCVKAADFDNDGDLDLFIGGRCIPGNYPLYPSSFIYRNDTQNGKIKFTNVTNELAPALNKAGMINDAIWTDFDNDKKLDLILVGEWTPIKFYKNINNKFIEITNNLSIKNKVGWFNCITAADLDNDGNTDYIIGNLGLNSFYKASETYPLNLYYNDFDANGYKEPIVTTFLKDLKGNKKEYTVYNRDDLIGQLPSLRKKYPTYIDFASATFSDFFEHEKIANSLKQSATYFSSCILKNLGKDGFKVIELPNEAQMSTIYGISVLDINKDGKSDICLIGNNFGNETSNGRIDALNGVILLGDGKGQFNATSISKSGFFVPGSGKSIVSLKYAQKGKLLITSENRGKIKVFR